MNEQTQEISGKQVSSLTLVERLKQKKISKVLLLDISGSMRSDLEPGHRKIDALREIVGQVIGNPICIMFNNHAVIGGKNTIPEPYGGTYMSKAINLAKEQGFREAIMITDGADAEYDEELALKAVENFSLQIMYVGLGEAPGFLDKLAKKAGGFCTVEDMKKPKELTNKVQLLLNESKGETKTNKTICL